MKATPYRDTKGPTPADRKKLVYAMRGRSGTRCGKRDWANFMLMDNPALWRAECIALDLVDVELRRRRSA